MQNVTLWSGYNTAFLLKVLQNQSYFSFVLSSYWNFLSFFQFSFVSVSFQSEFALFSFVFILWKFTFRFIRFISFEVNLSCNYKFSGAFLIFTVGILKKKALFGDTVEYTVASINKQMHKSSKTKTLVKDKEYHNGLSLLSRAFCCRVCVPSHKNGHFTGHMTLFPHKMIPLSAAYYSQRHYQMKMITWW